MSPNTNDGDGAGEMVSLDVTVPKRLLEDLDEMATELNYASRAEFVREVLRDTTEPVMTPGAQESISQGYSDVAAGRTISLDEATDRLGVDKE